MIFKKFIDEIFSPSSNKLEVAILKGFAKSLDKNGQRISPNSTNEQWLMANALGPLSVTMQVVKALIVKQIIGMIFGPKEKMAPNTLNNSIPLPSPAPTNDQILNNVVAAETMFSMSNTEVNQYGDLEFNTVELKKQLEKGQIQFTISCQDVKIKLPETFDQDMDDMTNQVINSLPGVSAGGGTVLNPSIMFTYITNHVGQETQRINTPENTNAVRKSFLQILVEKILNLIVIALSPYLQTLINQINTGNPVLNLTLGAIISSPLELKNLSSSDEAAFDQKSVFMSTVINALYAILLSILLKALIKEIKKLIKNALVKKAAMKIQSKFKRLNQIRASINNATERIEKAKMAAEALKDFNSIFNYT